jgi:hypothetical protein
VRANLPKKRGVYSMPLVALLIVAYSFALSNAVILDNSQMKSEKKNHEEGLNSITFILPEGILDENLSPSKF